jgi:hypothetical protein
MGLTNLPPRQEWAERSLQGLAFWIGYQQARFEGDPLTEGPLVAELRCLLHANRPKGTVVQTERLYRELLPPNVKTDVLKGDVRVDLVIAKETILSARQKELTPYLDFIIEAKRVSEAQARIDKDMHRLLEALTLSRQPSLRAWMFLISESNLPDKYVTEEGSSKPGPFEIPEREGKGWYVVRKSCKASARFETKEEAHYACLIEILTFKPTRSAPEKLADPMT